MLGKFAVGIDLGTSTSEIAVYRAGATEPEMVLDPEFKNPIIPSVVALNRRGELIVGEAALDIVDLPGQGVREVKRLMGTDSLVTLGGKTYRPEEISALILMKLMSNFEATYGIPLTEAVISVPANFDDLQRHATMQAAKIAGLEVIRLISEPTAAALTYGVTKIDAEEQLLVFDFGGGTLDVSILEMMNGVMDVKCSYGDTHLGGKDFDRVMLAIMVDKLKSMYDGVVVDEIIESRLKRVCERTKKNLSRAKSSDAREFAVTTIGNRSINLELEITRAEYEAKCMQLCDKARLCVRKAMGSTNYKPSSITGLLLVGGTTYMPMVRKLVTEMFGKEPRTGVDPDLAVSKGAAIQAAIIKRLISEEDGIILADVCSHRLCCDVVTRQGNQLMLVLKELIPRNKSVPYSVLIPDMSLLAPDQEALTVNIYQDKEGSAVYPDQAKLIATNTLVGIPPSLTDEPHKVALEFSYNINHTAELRASLPALGISVVCPYSLSGDRMSDEQIPESQDKVRELWLSNPNAKTYEPLIAKAERLLQELPELQSLKLLSLVANLKNAVLGGDEAQMESAANALSDELFELE